MPQFDEYAARTLKRIAGKIDSMRGPGVVNTPTAIAISNPAAPPRHPAAATALPKPQYQGMFYGGASQNQVGFIPIFAHAIFDDASTSTVPGGSGGT